MNKVTAIIIGLGNHANIISKPIKSRHSVGMVICNAIARKFDQEWVYERKLKAYVACVEMNNNHVMLMKSKYPMNLNGRSLIQAVRKFEMDANKVIVLHDDLDRGFGKLSWKIEGSASGHNGVKSVMSSLQTDKFDRLRIGIGRPGSRDYVLEYVLGNFTTDEFEALDNVIDLCINEVENRLLSKYQNVETR